MNININDYLFHLIPINNMNVYFPSYVNDYLKKYSDFLKKNYVIQEDTFNIINDFGQKIYACLLEYYCGQHSSARALFDLAISHIGLDSICVQLIQENFYRARKRRQQPSIFGESEMFHIPLEQRYKVLTQRYSYPGLPCLYLSSSYQVCVKEIEHESDDFSIAIITKAAKTNVLVLDLCFFQKYDFNNLTKEQFSKFIKLWPLVACCSFTFNNTEKMHFRPDYIIPQLLLEFIMDKNTDNIISSIDKTLLGIRYHSIKTSLFDKDDNYINYVFPVCSDNHEGLCPNLSNLFKINTVLSLKELN